MVRNRNAKLDRRNRAEADDVPYSTAQRREDFELEQLVLKFLDGWNSGCLTSQFHDDSSIALLCVRNYGHVDDEENSIEVEFDFTNKRAEISTIINIGNETFRESQSDIQSDEEAEAFAEACSVYLDTEQVELVYALRRVLRAFTVKRDDEGLQLLYTHNGRTFACGSGGIPEKSEYGSLYDRLAQYLRDGSNVGPVAQYLYSPDSMYFTLERFDSEFQGTGEIRVCFDYADLSYCRSKPLEDSRSGKELRPYVKATFTRGGYYKFKVDDFGDVPLTSSYRERYGNVPVTIESFEEELDTKCQDYAKELSRFTVLIGNEDKNPLPVWELDVSDDSHTVIDTKVLPMRVFSSNLTNMSLDRLVTVERSHLMQKKMQEYGINL